LDTNVLSELMRQVPDPAVLAWTSSFRGPDLGTTSVTIAELLFGVALLAQGSRQTGLREAVAGFIEDLGDGIYPFGLAAARCSATLLADRQRSGRSMSLADAQIAGIALSLDATLATRNTKDFEGCGLDLYNPFEPA
jgi:predicted nucleic acid-binding protein